ncbi:DUF4194 domain-containing protein [Lacisediminihabitans sp.]|jgi:hypothetical protein|uniref:DUF4194 domain-containing protein n=1 Tax=Lacisediminihabitans sp. TaxID=2787631 RepID=UPI002F93710F
MPDSVTTDGVETADAADEISDAASLFVGDTGVLDIDTRRAIVRLIRGPFLDGGADEAVWAALQRNDGVVRQFLSEIFLTLVVDDAERIAFAQQGEEADVAFPKLLRRVPLTLVDSALLLFLRQQLSTVSGTGQRAIVGLDDITAQLQPYQRQGASDHSIHAKRINAAVTKMRDNGILRATSTEARFEVSPVLRILFPPEQIAALTEAYDRLGEPDAQDSGDAEDRTGTETEDTTDD